MIIKIEQNKNGSHANQNPGPGITPEGWAWVPPGIEIPDTFPFVNIKVEDGVVTSMAAGIMPEPEPLEPEPEPQQPDGGDTESRLAALEENKADREDVAALIEAVERGLAL